MHSGKNEYRKLVGMGSVGGSSAGLCLPKEYLKNLSLVVGDFVKIHQKENMIVIQRVGEIGEEIDNED